MIYIMPHFGGVLNQCGAERADWLLFSLIISLRNISMACVLQQIFEVLLKTL